MLHNICRYLYSSSIVCPFEECILHYCIIFSFLDLVKINVGKERMTNLIPARIGVYSFFIFIFCGIITVVTHSVPFSDNATKALIAAFVNDAYFCLLAPSLILYGVPSTRKKLTSIMEKLRSMKILQKILIK